VSRIVTLLTDFGTRDGYVAEVKGVLLAGAPGIQVVDLAHDLEPGDVAGAAWALGRAWRTFPAGTVHLAVVDPGVGTARRAIAAEAGAYGFVAPDNGLLTWVLAAARVRAVTLPVPPGASATFHGRDVFAPAAAAMARGEPLGSLGTEAGDLVRLPTPPVRTEGADVVGHVVHVDRFGNLVTDVPSSRVAADAAVRVGVYDLKLRRTYADVEPEDLVAYVGSADTVEIAVRDGRADVLLGFGRGAEVRVRRRSTEGPAAPGG